MIKCLTLNTHSWLEDAPLDKLEAIAAQIIEGAYDLICLQEINQLIASALADKLGSYVEIPGTPPIHEDNFALKLIQLLEKQGQTYYWSWAYNHIGYDKYHEGVALLSKTPIKPDGILVSEMDDETDYHTRRALVAETLVNGRAVTVVSLHLSWFGKGFEGEWSKLEAALLDRDGSLVLMGDFNNPSHEQGYQMILSSPLELQDSHQVADLVSGDYTIKADIDGWDGNEKNLKVDHVFTSKDVNLVSSQVIFDGKASPVVSDHYGLTVTWN